MAKTTQNQEDKVVTKGYSLTPTMHAYLEQVAAQRDSNASRELRQIIRADMERASEKPKKRA